MSIYIERICACDGCGENLGGDDRDKSAKEIRWNRRQQGWVYRNGYDFCAECRDKPEHKQPRPQ
jgi:hypothetical protein